MRDLTKLARATYGRHLCPAEKVVVAANAIAGGTGRLIGTGLLIGVLAGALYATTVDTAAALPVMTFGGFAGIVGGYFLAEVQARRSAGPGSALVQLVMTDRRLLLLRRQPAVRFRPLRVYMLNEIETITSAPSRLGMQQRVRLHLHDAPDIDLYVAGGHDFAQSHRVHRGD